MKHITKYVCASCSYFHETFASGALGFLLTLAAAPVFAATTTTTFTVNANVLAVCQISATNVNFGNYDAALTSTTDTTATLTITCSNAQSYTVALDAGISAGGTVAARKMVSGANSLAYDLYTDAGHTTLWGNGTLSTVSVAGTGTGTPQNLTVYGSIPVNQHVVAGSYADDITATLTY